MTAESGAQIALDPATGVTLWTSATTYDGPSETASDGQAIYFGTGDGFLVAIDAATGAERWRLQPSPTTKRVHNPAIANGRVYVGTEGGGYFAIDTATHTVAWNGDLQGDDTGTASVAGGLAFIGTPIDTPTGRLRAFDATTGELRWTAQQPLLQFPTVAGDAAYSATQEGLVTSLDLATGSPRWEVQLSGKVRPMAVAGSILYLGADQEQKVYALDTATGGKLWSFDVDGSNDCCIAVAHGSVFVGTLAGSVYAIAGDGAAITPTPVATAPSSAPAPSDAPIAAMPVTVSWSSDLKGMGFSPISQIALDPKGRIWAPEAEGNHIAIHDPSGALDRGVGWTRDGPWPVRLHPPERRRVRDARVPQGRLLLRPRRRQSTRAALRCQADVPRRVGRTSAAIPGRSTTRSGSPSPRTDRSGSSTTDVASSSTTTHTGTVLGSFDPFASWPRTTARTR